MTHATAANEPPTPKCAANEPPTSRHHPRQRAATHANGYAPSPPYPLHARAASRSVRPARAPTRCAGAPLASNRYTSTNTIGDDMTKIPTPPRTDLHGDASPPAITPPRKHLERSAPGRVTGRLKAALDAMLWENLTDNEAASKFKITVTAIRLALKRPHVARYLREQRQVLHARELGRNSQALIKIRDESANAMAQVAAVREIERIADGETQHPRTPQAPGFVIIVQQPGPAMAQPEPQIINVTPAPTPETSAQVVYPHENDEAGPVHIGPSGAPVRELGDAFGAQRRLAESNMPGIDELAAGRAPRAPRRRPGGRLVE